MIENVAINDVRGYASSKDKLKRALYQLYRCMIVRCYSERFQSKAPSYVGCSVCERWLRFSNFLEDVKHLKGYCDWEKYVLNRTSGKITKSTMLLDKDGIRPMNTVYCPECCQFISLSESNAEMNRRNARIGRGQFSKEANEKRVRNTDFKNFREGQFKYAMGYAKPVTVVCTGWTKTFPSLHACARAIGTSKASVKHAAETGIPFKKTYKVFYGGR